MIYNLVNQKDARLFGKKWLNLLGSSNFNSYMRLFSFKIYAVSTVYGFPLMRFSWFLFLFLIVTCTSQKDDGPKITNLGTQLNYNIYGDGDTTLFFVHGWCINQTYWSDQVDYFKDRYRVVTVDLPGHGLSGKNRKVWSVENFGRDITVLIEALSLNNVVLIGHSMGGSIILEAASKKPEKIIGFIGVDNFKDFGLTPSEEEQAQVHEFFQQAKEDYQGVMKEFAGDMLFLESTPTVVSDRVMQDILNTPEDISIGILESLQSENDVEIQQMKNMKVKVHLINCDGYPTDEKQLKKYCGASYKVHSIGNLSHYPMIEDPQKFNDVLEDVLQML